VLRLPKKVTTVKSKGGRDVGMVFGAGYYPAYGITPRRKFKIQALAAGQAFIRAQGHSAFLHKFNPTPAVLGDFSKDIKAGRLTKASAAEQQEIRAPTSEWATSQAFEDFLVSRIFHKATAFNILGNFAWYQAGLSTADAKTIGKDIYNEYLGTIQRPSKILKAALGKVNNNIFEAQKLVINEFFEDNYSGYEEIEGTTLLSNIHQLAADVLNNGMLLTNKDLQTLTEEQLQKAGKDAPEEDYKFLNRKMAEAYGKNPPAGFAKPLDSLSKANKIDMKGWIKINGKRIGMVYDVTEALILEGAKTGEHGVGRAFKFDPALQKKDQLKHDWFGNKENRGKVKDSISAYFKKEIEDIFNPVIRGLKDYVDASPSKATEKTIKNTFVDPKTKKLLSGDALKKFYELDEAGEAFKFALDEANDAVNTWTSGIGGYAIETDPKKVERKMMKLYGYIFHNIMNIPNMTGNTFFQGHRVSERGPLGDAWYAAVPMKQYVSGKNIYEFKPEYPVSGGPTKGTVILEGPNLTLAFLARYTEMTPERARIIATEQAAAYASSSFHAGAGITSSLNQTNGAAESLCNASTVSATLKHATTVSYLPNFLPKFFSDIVDKIKLSGDEVEKLVPQQTLDKYSMVSPGSSVFDHFWALPYVSVLDTMERKVKELDSFLSGVAYEGHTTSWVGASPHLSKEKGFGPA